MKERPILFSGEMVKAILAGRKTQTRRLVKPQPPEEYLPWYVAEQAGRDCVVGAWSVNGRGDTEVTQCRCPYGRVGDRLWVRETWARVPRTAYWDSVPTRVSPDGDGMAAVYKVDWRKSSPGCWRSPIHMPRWASRIILEVTGIRAQRLLDIPEQDARAEGVESWKGEGHTWRDYHLKRSDPFLTARESFLSLWKSIHGKDALEANPWVWVVEFKRAEGER